MKFRQSAFMLASACAVFACSPQPEAPSEPVPKVQTGAMDVQTDAMDVQTDALVVIRDIMTANQDSLGTVTLTDLGAQGTEVTVALSGLDGAGIHAMHFHETGLCEAPDFSSAGGHYNPTGMDHGAMTATGPHAGDMMNIEIDSDGNGLMTVINERVSINGDHGLPALFDDNGSALIIHAGADDYVSQPSGAAGPRIGCALITAS
jgi:Cu-Zn family superoxide dismutase